MSNMPVVTAPAAKVKEHKLSLKEKPYIIKVPLFPDYFNRLVIYAESLGIYPPNTALVRIIFGKKEESFLLSSSMSKSGSIELMNNPGATASRPPAP